MPAARSGALAPFGVRSFRLQWPADLLTSWAFEMETLILGWYVLVETGSVALLTAFGALQLVGTLVAPMLGVVGDRVGPRNLLCAMRSLYAVAAATVACLVLAGALAPVHVFLLTGIIGLVRPSDLVMRNALIGATMPPALLMGAMGVARTTADSARVAGVLAGAGVVAALGMGPAYLAICTLYLLALGLTVAIGPRPAGEEPPPTERRSPWRELGDALAHVRATPHLLAGLLLAFLVNLTALPWMAALLPFVARDVYGMGQTGLAWLSAGFASGALAGSIVISRVAGATRAGRTMMASAVLWYALILVFALTSHPAAGIPVLFLAGFVQSLVMIPLAVMLLRGAGQRLRGRIMGLRMLAVYGLPVGLLAAGPLIERTGFAVAATLYGSVGLAATLAIAFHWRRDLLPAEAPANRR